MYSTTSCRRALVYEQVAPAIASPGQQVQVILSFNESLKALPSVSTTPALPVR